MTLISSEEMRLKVILKEAFSAKATETVEWQIRGCGLRKG